MEREAGWVRAVRKVGAGVRGVKVVVVVAARAEGVWAWGWRGRMVGA